MSNNKLINEMKVLEEFDFQNKPIITRTDKEGNILFANSIFTKMTGYSRAEYLGKPHNIVRHPDMPKEIFEELWKTILAGREWNGFIKNKTKCNKFYWVEACIQPQFENGILIGFSSLQRRVPLKIINRYDKIYKEMKLKEISM
jgi:aerotaxis receptor